MGNDAVVEIAALYLMFKFWNVMSYVMSYYNPWFIFINSEIYFDDCNDW